MNFKKRQFIKPNFISTTQASLNKKVTSFTHWKWIDEWKKLKIFDSGCFIGQSYFVNNGSQNFLIFQPIYKTLATFSGLPTTISEWGSKG